MERIHCLGIGGIGMGGIAEMLHTHGYSVTGSDLSPNQVTQRLSELGILIAYRMEDTDCLDRADQIIYSSAITESHPHRIRAKQKNIPCISRGEMLSLLMNKHFSIAVAGTHGKTSTTGLIAQLLQQYHLHPNLLIGGFLNSLGSNVSVGSSAYLLAEADESDGSFLLLHPKVSVITNIDNDHLEYYQNDFNRLRDAYSTFLHQAKDYAVICQDDLHLAELATVEIPALLVTYGLEASAMVQGVDFYQFTHYFRLTIIRDKLKKASLLVQVPLLGQHNVYNVLAAVAVATLLGIPDNVIQKGLQSYQGVARRLERLGSLKVWQGEVQVFDDYGHHPKEIQVTIEAIRLAYPNHRVLLVFQPHRYTRTDHLFNEFVTVLSTVVDYLLLLPIYGAGESESPAVNSKILAEAIQKKGGNVTLVDRTNIGSTLQSLLLKEDILIFQGAGDISQLARTVIKTWMIQEENLIESFH